MNRRALIAALLAGPFVRVQRAWSQARDLTSLTIAQASAQLAAREFTPLDLCNAYLSRIERMNRELNAFVTVTREVARRQARNAKPGQQLYGIPVAHKDLFETRNVRTTAGSLLFEHYTPDTNAVIVQQLESMGAVLLGKTNTHELGGGVTTINPFFGTTRNPVDRTRIPGGSSGGSAAAVASRMCAAATGSDTGGSVRIPAAFCGCVGFKPSHGRISTQGLIAASPTFDHVGFLTRSVEDAQILFRAVTQNVDSDLANPIRVGMPANYFLDGMAPEVEAAFSSVTARMGSVGARIVPVKLPIDDKTMSRVFDPVFLFELWGRFGTDWRTNPGSFSKQFSGVFSIPRPSVAEYEAGLGALKEFQSAVDKLFDAVDVIATPTVLMTAPPIAGPIDGMKILRNTWPFNAAGTPAISIPARTADARSEKVHLPVGIQLIGRRGEDDKLLEIARRFE